MFTECSVYTYIILVQYTKTSGTPIRYNIILVYVYYVCITHTKIAACIFRRFSFYISIVTVAIVACCLLLVYSVPKCCAICHENDMREMSHFLNLQQKKKLIQRQPGIERE